MPARTRWFFGLSLILMHLVLNPEIQGAIRTGKSNLYRNLEQGIPQCLLLCGSSMSQPGTSFWPTELQAEIKRRCSDTLRIWATTSTTPTGGSSEKVVLRDDAAMRDIIKIKPHAVSIEFAWADCVKRIPVDTAKATLKMFIRDIRSKLPNVEIFIYETGLPSTKSIADNPDLLKYYAMHREVADELETFFVPTCAKFQEVYNKLAGENRLDQWVNYVYDGHHPSLLAARELIVPSWLTTLSGSASGPVTAPRLSLSIEGTHAYYIGDTMRIQVIRTDPATGELAFSFSTDNTRSFVTLSGTAKSPSGILWKIPEKVGTQQLVSSDSAFLRAISPVKDTAFTAAFSLIARYRTMPAIILKPLTSTVYRIGETIHIEWQRDTTRIESVDLEISLDGGKTYNPIGTESFYGTSYDWIIPAHIAGRPTSGDSAIIRATGYLTDFVSISQRFAITTSLFVNGRESSRSATGAYYHKSVHIAFMPASTVPANANRVSVDFRGRSICIPELTSGAAKGCIQLLQSGK